MVPANINRQRATLLAAFPSTHAVLGFQRSLSRTSYPLSPRTPPTTACLPGQRHTDSAATSERILTAPTHQPRREVAHVLAVYVSFSAAHHHVQGRPKCKERDQGLLAGRSQGPQWYVTTAYVCASLSLTSPATSNDPWGPVGSDMAEIAQITFNK